MFTLIIEDQDGAIADEYSFEEGEFIVGRSHSSDIILPSDNVSRRHARLYTQNGRCYIEDLNSSNGVFVNGKRIHRVFEIVRSAQIKVGDYYVHVEGASYGDEDLNREVERQEGEGRAREMGVSIEDGEDHIAGRLVGTNMATQGRPFDLFKAVNLVGRGKDCAVTIIDPSVSRVHAKILRTSDGGLAVEDQRSSNGTYVNDERVSEAPFFHGDKVRFGNVEFICEMPGMGDPEVVEVSSGARKGLLFLVIFLFLVLAAGGVTVYLLRDTIWPDTEEVAEKTKEDLEAKLEAERLAKEEQFQAAQNRIEGIVEKAERLAGRDKWQRAQEQFRKGAKQLERIGSLDAKGELTAYFENAEVALRQDRRDYEEFIDALEEKDYQAAGLAFLQLAKRKGAHWLLAKGKLTPAKDGLLESAELLCNSDALEKCLKLYQRAKALDPSDEVVAKKVAKLRLKLNTAKVVPAP